MSFIAAMTGKVVLSWICHLRLFTRSAARTKRSVAAFTGVRVENEPVSALLNLYAAVPSMHVCFALMVGWPLARLVKPRPLKVVWFLYPFLVTFVVVATGNHYFFDAFLGAMTAGMSALLSKQLLARWRPEAWSFRRAEAKAAA